MATKKNLDKLIQEATIDCYDEEECISGFYTMIEENVQFPFQAIVVGEAVEVVGVELVNSEINAHCLRNGKIYAVNISNVEYNPKMVIGSKWIDAYKKWIG